MLKKGIVGAGVVALLAGLCFGRDAWSYVTTSAGWLKSSVKDSVPIEFEIDRARKMVKDLVPDIRANMHVIAKEEVELARLERQVDEAEGKLAQDRAGVQRLRDDLASGQSQFQYAGRSYSANEVKVDLANRFERFKTADATLASLREIQKARQRSLEGARAKLEGMLAAKRKLEVDVENLEARMKMIEAAQTTAEYQFDDSRLSRAKELISDLRTRLDVAEKMTNADSTFHDQIPLEAAPPADLLEDVTDYLNGGAKPIQSVADTTAP